MNAKKIMVLTVCLLVMAVQGNAEETLTITAIENLNHGFITERILKEAYKRIGIKKDIRLKERCRWQMRANLTVNCADLPEWIKSIKI